MDTDRFETFEDFWPFYLTEHSHPANRALHFAGTSAVIAGAATALLGRRPRLLLLLPLLGYGPAWIGHFLIEKNRPATFTYPTWSLLGDFRMWGLMVAGKLDAEMQKARATRR